MDTMLAVATRNVESVDACGSILVTMAVAVGGLELALGRVHGLERGEVLGKIVLTV